MGKDIKEGLKNIFHKFYYLLLSDVYYSRFFNSFSQINSLIEDRQINFLIEIIEELRNGKDIIVYEKLLNLAKLHKKINISSYFMFKGIDLLEKIVKEEVTLGNCNFDLELIKRFFYLLRKSTAEIYISNFIDEGIALLKKDLKWQKYQIENILELKCVLYKNNYCRDCIPCPLETYINSIEFQIKTALYKKDRYKFQIYHYQFHKLLEDFVDLYKNERFLESCLIIEDIINIGVILNSLLEDIDLKWELNKREAFSTYLMEHARNFNLRMLPTKKTVLNKNIVTEIYNFLKKFYEDNLDVFVFIDKGFINLVCDSDFNFEDLKESLSDFCKKNCLVEGTILKIASLKVDDLFRLKSNKELFLEFMKVIEEEMENIETDEIVAIFDLNKEIDTLLFKAQERLKIKKLIQEALNKKEVTIFIQEIFDLKTLKSDRGEILARVLDENKNPIPAFKFIEFLRKEHLEEKFDLAIINTLINNLEKISLNTIFLNLFPSSFDSKEVIDNLNELAKKAKKLNKKIVAEITEYSISNKTSILNSLKENNLEIAFDDFGVGYTNFELVGMLASHSKANTLKIDGNLVKRIDDKVHRSILKAIVTFANENNLDVIFEFIENEDILNKVKKITKDLSIKIYGQGYYFSKPHPLS